MDINSTKYVPSSEAQVVKKFPFFMELEYHYPVYTIGQNWALSPVR
jgi:hypothetical protein